MALEDIERLKEKISRDPNSKLFVPLAEEYKKAGMLDEAIEVLTGGLENQPGYLSARVSLGKIFIDRGMLREAQTEFEKVIAAIPDNLYAHKKLAEIYKELGDKDKATKELRTVLKLNPLDDWAAASLSEIEQQPATLPEKLPVPETEEVIPVDEKTPDASLSEENMGPSQPPSVPVEELQVEEKEVPEFALDAEELKPGGPSGEIKELRDEEIEETALSEEDMAIWKSHAESLKSVEEEAAEEVTMPEPVVEADEIALPEPVTESETEAFPAEGPLSFEGILNEEAIAAMNIYRKILAREPDNKKALQRVEELRALLKLLGKDKEELVSKLDGFLDGIRKRHDEFSGNT
jgi:tetratricopeptide (TPR) repeat protein